MATEVRGGPGGWQLPRPLLDETFDTSRRRVCVVLGTAGWGKTAAVTAWAARRRSVWLTYEGRHDAAWILDALERSVGLPVPASTIEVPAEIDGADRLGAIAARVCKWLRDALAEELLLVVDDLQWLRPGSEAARLLEGLCWHTPERLRIVLVSRREPPFSLTRLRGQGLLTEINASQLAFGPFETAVLLRQAVDQDAAALAEDVWARTGGWPAAVNAAMDLLSRVDVDQRPQALERLTSPGERFHTYLAEEVIGREPSWVQDFLRRTAVFGGITSPATIGFESPDPAAALADLTRRGFLRRSSGEIPRWTLLPPLADYFQHETVMPGLEHAGLHAAAAAESMARGAYGEALRHLVAAGDDGTTSLVVDCGATLLNTGDADAVLEAVESAPVRLDDDVRLQHILDEARQAQGGWSSAFAAYQRAAGTKKPLAPELAWRIMWMLQMQGEFGQIVSLFERVALAREDTLDEAWLLGQVAVAHRMLGDLVTARRLADRAMSCGRRSGRPSALGPGHNVLAMLAAADGDHRRLDAHFSSALDIAEAENDLIQQLWVRVCRAVHLVEMSAPRDARAEAAELRDFSQRYEIPFLEAHARTILGRASLRLGFPDTAAEELATAIEIFQRLGSRYLAWPVSGLGDLHRTRGQLARARTAYEEALRTAADGPDSIGTSYALMGLARVRAADDLPLARRLADRAVAASDRLHEVGALLTRGWVALLDGERRPAVIDAARAGSAARRRRDDLGLAEAILLSVQVSENPAVKVDLLDEAIQIWEENDCLLEAAVARIVAGTFGGRTSPIEADRAAQLLRASGVDIEGRRAAGPLAVLTRSAPTVSIEAMGVFQVIRDGMPVPKGEWQSKKARDLLKILIAHRRPTPRERLQELLWPGTAPARSANRLSVLLSMLRDILQPDRAEAGPLQSDGSAVRLDRSRIRVDVEDFLERADVALESYRSDRADAQEQLVAALATYGGEFLQDEPYEDWAAPLAEEVRTKYTALLRALVSTFRAAGDVDRATDYGLRLLEQDPYDEEVRLDLIEGMLEAGRLGEARRHYEIYARRMQEIDVEPRPMPRPDRTPPAPANRLTPLPSGTPKSSR
jgi:DNA-binding SARP family transcriptional activator/tetratricopeptide (TPR) repeat protein